MMALPPGLTARVGQPRADYKLLGDVMVSMRDGVRLATDVYVPATSGPRFPVILERTPYNKTAPSRSERTPTNPTPLARPDVAGFYARHGYVVVYQDCRGRYKSEGEFVKYLSDGNDGYDTCAWILKQPWCNGRIATTPGALALPNAPCVCAAYDNPIVARRPLHHGCFTIQAHVS